MNENVLIRKIKRDCPFCDKEHEIEMRKRLSKVTIKDHIIEYYEKYFLCSENKENNEFVSGELMEENLLNARDEYRRLNGLLTSKEIKQIRNKYSLTQSEMSLLLGWGEITVTRYESKLIQDATYDKVMRLIRDNAYYALLNLQNNKEKILKKINAKRYNTIEENIKDVLADNTLYYLNNQEIMAKYVNYDNEMIENGFKKLDISKLELIENYIAKNVNNLYKVKLMKMLWYCDFMYYKTYKKSLTGLVYFHKEMGALPLAYNELLKLKSINVEEEQKTINNNVVECFHISANEKNLEGELSFNEKNVIDKVIDKFKNFDSIQIVNYMHKEKAYIETKANQIISYEYAKYIDM